MVTQLEGCRVRTFISSMSSLCAKAPARDSVSRSSCGAQAITESNELCFTGKGTRSWALSLVYHIGIGCDRGEGYKVELPGVKVIPTNCDERVTG